MKKIILLLLLFTGLTVFAQYPEGTVKVDSLYSKSLENSAGENPTRSVHIYLPPGYEKNTKRYPVIYYLHGFTSSDRNTFEENHLDALLDQAIATGKIKPVIMVLPNNHTLYRGSFYTNSSYTGNWGDFTAMDLVAYIDKNYRTIAEKESRGVAGHSMGGHGAIKMGMLYPDVFSNVYALSPGVLGLVKDMGIEGYGYKSLQQIKTREELVTGYDNFLANAVIAMGQAFAPNPNKPPFYADLPFNYEGDSLIVDYTILEKWNKNMPLEMVDTYAENLKQLNAIKIDWGRNEQFPHIPITSRSLSQKLENMGINHYAEEYIGTHGNKLWTDDGRVLNDLLPFFNMHLKF